MSADTPDSTDSTSFDRALQTYLDGLPKDKQKCKFVALCRGSGDVSPQLINDLIQQEQAKRALSGPVKRLFNRLTSALNDYSEVMGQLASVQPLPLAIIWGALKVVIESASRCNDMFDLMKDELRGLIDQIQRITDYEDLYNNSEPMQDLFFRSYTNIIRFWHRVHKECKRGGFDTFRHALTSSNTKKLNAIVNDLKYDVDCIAKKASIVQAELDSKEYAEAQKERAKAEEERIHQSDWRLKQSAHNYLELSTRIRDFLTPAQAFSANINRHESNLQHYQDDTCCWLIEDPNYNDWSDPRSRPLNSVFCLSGPAGYGKSILSSYAIRDLQNRGATVAYYFCQFSQPCDSVSELLRLFALQLFNVYFERHMPVDDALCHKVLCSTSNEQLQDLVHGLSLELAPAYFEIDGLDEAQLGSSQATLSYVLRFICTKLVDNARARLWITKRRQARPVECFDAVTDICRPLVLEMADQTEGDVVRYLRAKFTALKKRLGELSEEDNILFRFAEKGLTSRAKGHFLWARLMTQSFEGEDRIEDVSDLLSRVCGPPPEGLDDLYQQIFRRIKPENRKVASKIMALIAFSRRQLRIEEVRDAAVLLITRGKKNANDGWLSRMSITTFFSKFTVLVEIDKGLLPEEEGSCRLVHSSVLELLINKPAVLGDERAVHITPYTIADACLLYLSRPIYTRPIKRHPIPTISTSDWVDSSGRSMDEHHFVQYAAKHWWRHLEDVDLPQDPLRKRVASFIESPNFQTCMQIQSIWVQGQFDVYTVGGEVSLLRVFPDWFIRGPPTSGSRRRVSIAKHWSDYRLLLHDWQGFLSCGGCHDSEPNCPLITYRGELDHIWWDALSPKHLFSGFSSRFTSFSLNVAAEAERRDDRFEAISVTTKHIVVLRLSSWDHISHTLRFICEWWSSENPERAPNFEKMQVICTDEASTNWHMYAGKRSNEFSKTLVAWPVMISKTAEHLRIGAQVFRLDDEQEFRPLTFAACNSRGETSGAPGYFEDLCIRDSFFAFSTRAHTAAQQLQNPYLVEEHLGKDIERMERWAPRPIGEEDADFDSDGEETEEGSDEDDGWSSDDDRSECSDSEVDGYESWSEGSTEDEDAIDSDLLDDSDDEMQAADSDSEFEESDSDAASASGRMDAHESQSEGSGSSDDEDAVKSEYVCDDSIDDEADSEEVVDYSSTSDLDNDDASLGSGDFRDPQVNSDEEEDAWGHAIDSGLGTSNDGRPVLKQSERSADEPIMQLIIFDTTGEAHRKVFRYTHTMAFMLYASPPAFHPREPLVVWPLGAGDVLFADFERKTYFTRKLRPSAPYTRNISVKIHFHPKGRFLHIACLEAQIAEVPKKSRKQKSDSSTNSLSLKLKLFVLLSTYRLSSRKTTRSPPYLIHRVKVDLGRQTMLVVSRLPFTFTWTNDDLFVTRSAPELNAIRIALFADPAAPRQHVFMPNNKIFLPQTALLRDVYFSPVDNNAPARIVIGSERPPRSDAYLDLDEAPLRKTLSPPVGCLLRENDIGGWVTAEDVDVRVPRGQGVGKLDRRKERFDPVDDCDVEPYLLFA